MSNSLNNKRIVKNTLFLYFRMGITMLVSLYTSRIVLNALGVQDYGIYNVVASFIVSFTFISAPLGGTIQRFFSYAIGEDDFVKLNKLFNISCLCYLFIAILIFVLLEIGGVWFILNKMHFPEERSEVVLNVFHLSSLSLVFALLKTSFDSLVIAKEKMNFYAYISIIEVLLQLLNAYTLIYFSYDKLLLYASNVLAIRIIVFLVFAVFSLKAFKEISLKFCWDRVLFKQMLSFSGWTFFSSVSTMTANQGLNILLNLFFGVVLNTAMGLATQISNAVNQFVSSFQMAFNPQIVKSYASGNLSEMRVLVLRTAKYSYFLLFAIVCPVIYNMQYILDLWLKNTPAYTVTFTTYLLIWILIETLMAPLWMSVTATGKIKTYHITMSLLIFLNIIFSYLFLKLGFPPEIVVINKCWLDILYLIVRLKFTQKLIGLSIKSFLKSVILPVALISTIYILPYQFLFYSVDNGLLRLMYSIFVVLFFYPILVISIGVTKGERKTILLTIKQKIHADSRSVRKN